MKVNGVSVSNPVKISFTREGSLFEEEIHTTTEDLAELLSGAVKYTDQHLLETFEDFWNKYNKKVGKEKSYKIWCKKLKQSERDAILERVGDFVLANPDQKYRPNPETFFNGKRWLDELNMPKKIKQESWAKPNTWQ